MFPEDVVYDILVKLPVKTLIRFRSVSKSWKALIKSPQFIQHHLSLSKHKQSLTSSSSPSFLVLPTDLPRTPPFLITIDRAPCPRCRPVVSVERLSLPDAAVMEPDRLTCSERFSFSRCLLGCVCCGVYCFARTTSSGNEAVIWNPATREAKKLPLLSASGSYFKIILDGFSCYNNKDTRDFKFMRVLHPIWGNGTPVVEVYTLSSNSWRTASGFDRNRHQVALQFTTQGNDTSHAVNLNTKAHWLGSYSRDQGLVWLDRYNCYTHQLALNAVLFFDFETEVFGLIQLPDDNALYSGLSISLTLLDNKFLCLIDAKRAGHDECRMWVMREYGTTKDLWVPYSFACNCLPHPILWFPMKEKEEEEEINGGLVFQYTDIYVKCNVECYVVMIGGESSVALNVVNHVSSLVPI